tara:strand:- start:1292 stop:1879 length:588 start_codon:yes stop_codon:yes gene_type:complete
MNYSFLYSGPLLFKSSLKESDRLALLDISNKNKKIKFNKELSGYIKEEYKIKNLNPVKKILKENIDDFVECYEHWYGKQVMSVEFKNGWTNFMKAHEYNPPHVHQNCNFASVFYLDVPEEIKKEENILKTNGSQPGNITFQFHTNVNGYIQNHRHEPKTGDFFIFPATLIHTVNPFYSKVTRISMAINFEVTEVR